MFDHLWKGEQIYVVGTLTTPLWLLSCTVPNI